MSRAFLEAKLELALARLDEHARAFRARMGLPDNVPGDKDNLKSIDLIRAMRVESGVQPEQVQPEGEIETPAKDGMVTSTGQWWDPRVRSGVVKPIADTLKTLGLSQMFNRAEKPVKAKKKKGPLR